MEQRLSFSIPELWYPYSESRVAPLVQGTAYNTDNSADYSANRSDHSRLDGLVLGS